ncbi:Uncharacterised protein [Acinetobacter calcoaceticus]|uniref:HEAT repeat domain-containing protein n=1 Tax=Acinetobacter calcoaceticus TaxID=471 RepID=A0A446ZEY0_ACICA|nr:hypothetical protein [Acinetobacter calcoaceticus]VAX43016.1 Uncharacterised protein [Acinetobacter calcoaceticus]
MNKQFNFNKVFNHIESVFSKNSINLDKFNTYLSPKVYQTIGEYLLELLERKHDFVPSFNPAISSRTTLLQTQSIHLELEILPANIPPRNFISPNGSKQAIGVLIGSAKIQIFSKKNDKKEIIEISKEIISSGQSTLIDHELVVIENNSTVSTYLLYLTDNTNVTNESIREVYSINTGKFSHIVSNSLASSRLELMLFTMGHMNYKACSDVAEHLAFNHSDYFIRWEATRTFCKVNPDQAEIFLSRVLAEEQHPHVINAINQSLFLIQNRNK